MNPIKLTQELKDFVVKTITAQLVTIVKNQQSITAVGTIVQVDYASKRATVRLGSSVTGFLSYSKHFTDSQIGTGQSVLLVSSDANNLSNRVILATLSDV